MVHGCPERHWLAAISSPVILRAVRIFGFSADILISQLLRHHVSLRSRLLFAPDVEERLVQSLLQQTLRETEVFFVSRSSGEEKRLQHGKRQVVVELTCSRQLTCVLPKIDSKALQILSSVLRGMASLNCRFEIFESFNQSRLDCLDELEPDNRKWVPVFRLFFDSAAHESWRQRRQKILDGSTVVVLVVQQQLRCTEGLGGLNGIPGMTFDGIRHRQRVFRVWEISSRVHSAVGEVVPYLVLEVHEVVSLREGGRHAGMTVVVPLLGGRGMDRPELITRRHELIGGGRVKAHPTGVWLATGPGRPVILGNCQV